MVVIPFEYIIGIVFATVVLTPIMIVVLYYKFKISAVFVIVVGSTTLSVVGFLMALFHSIFDYSPIAILLGCFVLLPIDLGAVLGQYWYFQRPLKQLIAQTQAIEAGDLTAEVAETPRKDEYGVVLNGFARMYASLRATLQQTSQIADLLATSAQEMASSAEEVNASSEEISSITQQISHGTQHQTEQSNVAVKRTEAMKSQFNEQIQGIETTAELIETISGQVNMLALNASIEAARAGEYGRGFAVVADNIRRLAEETKQSLNQVTHIIETLRKALGQEIDLITVAVQTIASISEETAAGAEEASAATEEQAATMQEMSASAQELAKLAIDMEALVKEFKLSK
ncbi:MAG: methyl-accepting chemotaxis protein [Candidatus Hermodarchaeota archaeon]